MIGLTLDGKYRLLRLLGEGGMGSVYVARKLDDGRDVAVKLINADALAQSPGLLKRFQREARATGTIDTPNIVRVFDSGVDSTTESPYMAMELLRGLDLLDFSRKVGPVAPDTVLRIAAQACLGLAAAHAAGVIHRDIKPANIFLAHRDPPGAITVKLLDFGIAKSTLDPGAGETQGLTRTGTLLGSPLYMSPEQARGAKRLSAQTDLWSLGMVMFHLLAGRAVYQHLDHVGALMVAICSAPPPSVQNVAPWVPKEIAGILDRARRLDPDDRYPGATAMLTALRALLPDGEALTEARLVGMSEGQRCVVAARFDASEVRRDEALESTSRPPAPSGTVRLEGPSIARARDDTAHGVASSGVDQAPSASRGQKALLFAGAAAVSALVVSVMHAMVSPAPTVAATPEPGMSRALPTSEVAWATPLAPPRGAPSPSAPSSPADAGSSVIHATPPAVGNHAPPPSTRQTTSARTPGSRANQSLDPNGFGDRK